MYNYMCVKEETPGGGERPRTLLSTVQFQELRFPVEGPAALQRFDLFGSFVEGVPRAAGEVSAGCLT